jgi:uncharacterized protein
MINENLIKTIINKLIEIYNPLEIYLFGSYAWGQPNEDSDLDILVVIDKYYKDRHQVIVDGHKALVSIHMPKDILVYTKEEFDRFSNDVTRFCYNIKHKGKKIYAKA